MEDRGPAGWEPGGPALYAAQMARELGQDVTLVTNLTPGYRRNLFRGIDLRLLAAVDCPRYENTYDGSGNRAQLLRHEGEPIHPSVLLAAFDRPADVAVIAPAYHEFEALPAFTARVAGLSLQGWLRSRSADDRVVPHPDPWGQVGTLPRPGWFAFFSEEDTAEPDALAARLAGAGVRVLLTRGQSGVTSFSGSRVEHHDALPARLVDPTGAGDCFATSFLVRYGETSDENESVRFALAAGALAVEGPGLSGIPSRAEIRARLAEVAA